MDHLLSARATKNKNLFMLILSLQVLTPGVLHSPMINSEAWQRAVFFLQLCQWELLEHRG